MIYLIIFIIMIIFLIVYLVTKEINRQHIIVYLEEIIDLLEYEDDEELKGHISSFLEENKNIINKTKHLKEKYEKIVC